MKMGIQVTWIVKVSASSFTNSFILPSVHSVKHTIPFRPIYKLRIQDSIYALVCMHSADTKWANRR